MHKWQPGQIHIADEKGVQAKDGYTCDGLGIHQFRPSSPKGRKPAWWTITHLNTGHSVLYVNGDLPYAQRVANELLALGIWEFMDLMGWKNIDPHLFTKVSAAIIKYGRTVQKHIGDIPKHSFTTAKKVLQEREKHESAS